MKDYYKELEIAKKVIKSAGNIVSKNYTSSSYSYKSDNSILTQTDIDTEKFLKTILLKNFPEYGFICEESNPDIKDISWIIDPIDGTLAFARHIDEYGIALSLKKNDQVIFGLLYFPFNKKLVWAYKGKGAFENDKQIFVGQQMSLDTSYISIGLQNMWYEKYRDQSVRMIDHHRFRVGPSSVVEAYYMASGKVDLLLRYDQPIWDVAAQYIIMEEAGAMLTDHRGSPLHLSFDTTSRHNLVAINKHLYKNSFKEIYENMIEDISLFS